MLYTLKYSKPHNLCDYNIDDLRPKEWLGAKTCMFSFFPCALQEVAIL